MKRQIRLVGLLLLLSIVFVSLYVFGRGGPIRMGPGARRVPQFIGSSAKPNSLPPMAIPQHPYLADQGKNGMHADSYISGTYPWSGPLGINPQVDSASMALVGGMVATLTVDRQGRLVGVNGRLSGFKLLLMDARTLDVLASHRLPQRASIKDFLRTLDMNVFMYDTSGGAYFHLDHQDRPIIGNADNIVQIFRVDEAGKKPKWQVDLEFDLNPYLPDGSYVTDAMPDWNGQIWFVARTGIVGVIEPTTSEVQTSSLVNGEIQEEIQNAMAVAQDGVYIVSDYAMYRFETDGVGAPVWTWRQEYDRGSSVKPGAINQGSGTTPTLLDVPQAGSNPIKLVAITDNADGQVNLVVYERLTGEKTCEHPLFDRGYSVSENSVIGYRRSFIVENNYSHSGTSFFARNPRSHPGVTRIDMNESCTACELVWESREASQTVVPKLSVGNGLVYLYTRLEGPEVPDDVVAWYFTAIDFETGETVYKIFTGTGRQWNNSYAPITLGPDGTAYVGVFNGIVSIRDEF